MGRGGLSVRAATSEVRSPMNELLLDYLPLVIFIGVRSSSAWCSAGAVLVAYKAPDSEKMSALSAGSSPYDDARIMKFDVRIFCSHTVIISI
jgi:NADH-quinone oxidoreductase subunit A